MIMKKTNLLLVPVVSLLIGIGSSHKILVATQIKNESQDLGVIYDNFAVDGGIQGEIVNIDKPVTIYDPDAAPTSRNLNLQWVQQQNNYFCGPASVYMLVRPFNSNISQDSLAKDLGTTSSGGTGFGSNLVTVLNNKTGIQWGLKWHTYSDISTIQSDIVSAICYGNGVLLNTIESPGDYYFAGHNNYGTLYHYGVIDAYTQSGAKVTYKDPGAGRFTGFVQSQTVPIKNASYACGGRGYVW